MSKWPWPEPKDDGAAKHLIAGTRLPDVALPATFAAPVNLARYQERAIVFIYPFTGTPGEPNPPDWDTIPGAHGSTPEAEGFRDQYAAFLKAVAEAPTEPHESVGVWVSGFFGSGKSSFAKNFGYALENRRVLGQDFSALFKQQIRDEQVRNLLDLINTRFPTEVILFDIAKEQDTRRVTQRIAEFIYTALLRELDYAEDFDIAELEIELEAEAKLDQFIAKCKQIHSQEWRIVRKGAQRLSRASAVLHALDPVTYPAADSWAHTQRSRDAAISVSKVVHRTFELFGRRRPGKALVLVIDEVGQHVARSGDKIEDLRATIEEFGKVGRNLLKARKIPAPCWIVVTSQEKLDEVVAAIDSKRVELAKLQDRFRHRVDLAPSDIREVATRRVLAKKDDALPILRKLSLIHISEPTRPY